MITVQLPDGRSVQIDTDDQNVAAQAAAKFMRANPAQAQQEQAPAQAQLGPADTGAADAYARKAFQGATAGFGDELGALANAYGLGTLQSLTGSQLGASQDYSQGSYGDNYARSLAALREREAADAVQHPTASMLGQLTGNLAAGFAVPGVTSASLPVRLAANAGVGTALGTLQAAGENNGDAGQRTTAALQAIPYAAAGSAAGVGVGEAAGALGRAAGRYIGDRLGTDASTGRFINRLAQQAGVTPRTNPIMGGELPIEQLGDVGAQAASATAAERGTAGTTLRNALNEAVGGQRERVIGNGRSLLQTDETVPQAAERLSTARANQARELYGVANEEAVASSTAGAEDWNNLTSRGHLADIANGSQFKRGLEVDFDVDNINQLTPMQRMQALDKEITGRISSADRSGDTNLVRQLKQQQAKVRDVLARETPTYLAAAAAYSHSSQLLDALDLGKETFRQNVSNPQFFSSYDSKIPEAQDLVKLSTLEDLERIAQSKDRSGKTNVLRSLDNDLVQDRLRHMFGDDFNISRESNLADLRNAVTSGSQTAQRQANRIPRSELGNVGVAAAVDSMSGAPVATGLKLASGLFNSRIPTIAQNRASALTDWQAFARALQAARAAQNGTASRLVPGALGISIGSGLPSLQSR